MAHNVLVRAIRHAERDDLVGRNVAALVKPPKGQLGGRPSKSLTLEQAVSLMAAARGTRLEAYIALSLQSGVRTEKARALRWDHVAWVSGQWVPVSEAGFDLEQVAVFAWRAERAGGDTKTPESRRTLALPRKYVEALREHGYGRPRPASRPGVVAGSRAGVRVGGGDADGRPQRTADVPGDHRGRGTGHEVGAAGDAAYLRAIAVRRAAFRWRRSRCWPGTTRRPRRSWSTGIRSCLR